MNGTLLWVDDEMELLKAYVIFLEKKGYSVRTATNGQDALDMCREQSFDMIFLDENMPGLSGLETLTMIKDINPVVPVVMVTKSEEEDIMNQAIGSKIADYLIKPVNPSQILLTLKKHLYKKEIEAEVTNTSYQQEFAKIGMQINDSYTLSDWKNVYKRLVTWELKLSDADSEMTEMLQSQKSDANSGFAKFIKKNYIKWMEQPENRPLMSPDIFKTTVFPLLDSGDKVFLMVFDNFRYDQWREIAKELSDDYTFDEQLCLSILPTATQYARNAIFSGLMPMQIAQMFPDLWVDEDEDEGKNLNEEALIQTQIERYRRKHSYTLSDWKNVYKRLVTWELKLSDADSEMTEMLQSQKSDANSGFAKFIKKNYIKWMEQPENRPLMSPDIFKTTVFPLLDSGDKVFLMVFDNFRYDQWREIAKELSDDYTFDEQLCLSILPTATQYARNAIFSGLMPMQIAQMFPDLWVDEDEDEGKNLNEEALIQTQIERYRRKHTFSYFKLNDSSESEKIVSRLSNLLNNDLNVVVINFIDMLSHARTESRMVRELASDEKAYRGITSSWFRNSPIRELFRELAKTDVRVVITTDHGSIRVNTPLKVVGDKNTNTNLRYKLGKNLSYNSKQVFELKNPKAAYLPSPNISTTYIFAQDDSFFAYPNNYNYYVGYYKNTFQHGGISMEEMLVPLVVMQNKKRRQA